jgi:DNA-binding MarR family transcriptional regulator
MDHDLESSQTRAVLDFMLFLSDTLSQRSKLFEQETLCSPDEVSVISLLTRRGPMMVKQIAEGMLGIDPSKLTRILDSLEKHGYATRTLNREDRRSFLVTPTERGRRLLDVFTGQLGDLAQDLLAALTPAERLILVELFTKVQANWNQRQDA